VFYVAVPWVFFAVSIVGLLIVVNVFFPIRREPLSVVSFVLGWIPGELPVQLLLVELVGIAVFARSGALHRWPGWIGLGMAALSAAGLVRLGHLGHKAGDLVDAALTEIATDPPVSGPGEAGSFDPRPAWNSWWRLGVAVPFRWRSIRRIRNIDYWGDGAYRHRLDVLQLRKGPCVHGPVMIYIHGGAWILGDKREQGIPMMHELVARGWVCVAINYRLSPRATWPDHVIDCKRALAWVKEHIADYGGDPGFVAVAGGSAGGHLASLIALTPNEPEWQPGFEEVDTKVDACIPFYGAYDMTGSAGSGEFGTGLVELLERRVMKVSITSDRERFEQASPIHRVNETAPPMLIFHGTNDTLVPVGVARNFVTRLREVSPSPVAYVEFPRAQHAFDVLGSIRCRHATMGVVRFLEERRARVSR
jgi:acetyl esterase/lipase